jgi:hypothetical protein
MGVLAPPIAWAADLTIRYALVKWTCGTEHFFVLPLVTLGALALTGAGGINAWRAFRATPADAPTDGGRPVERGRFMAIAGLCTSVFFAFVLLAGTVPVWMLDACR